MWDMMNYFENKVNLVGKSYKSVKSLSRYDCKDETVGISSLVQFSEEYGSGDVVGSYTIKKNEIEDAPIAPESTKELLWQIACGRK